MHMLNRVQQFGAAGHAQGGMDVRQDSTWAPTAVQMCTSQVGLLV